MGGLLLLFWKMNVPRRIFRSGLKTEISSIFLINNPPGGVTHPAGPAGSC